MKKEAIYKYDGKYQIRYIYKSLVSPKHNQKGLWGSLAILSGLGPDDPGSKQQSVAGC